jgi:hypothetical protein
VKSALRTLAIAIIAAASAMTASAKADEPLSLIRHLLLQNSIICADFEQHKSLRALNRPLVSRGKLRFLAGTGILWQVQEPIPTRVLIKNDALVKWDEENKPHRLSVGQTPIFQALSDVFAAVFSGEMEGLRDAFEVEPEINDPNWRLTLTPRDKSLSAIISAIRLAGGRFIEELIIEERRGDQTLIQFSNVTAKTCELSSAEQGYFAH